MIQHPLEVGVHLCGIVGMKLELGLVNLVSWSFHKMLRLYRFRAWELRVRVKSEPVSVTGVGVLYLRGHTGVEIWVRGGAYDASRDRSCRSTCDCSAAWGCRGV